MATYAEEDEGANKENQTALFRGLKNAKIGRSPGSIQLILKHAQVLLHIVCSDGRFPLAARPCDTPKRACTPSFLRLHNMSKCLTTWINWLWLEMWVSA